MNQRIKELADEAGMYVDLNGNPWPKWMSAEECEVAYNKFAELIVKECITMIQLSTARDPRDTIQYKQSVGHIHKIRDHFGIVPTINNHMRSRSTYFGNNP